MLAVDRNDSHLSLKESLIAGKTIHGMVRYTKISTPRSTEVGEMVQRRNKP